MNTNLGILGRKIGMTQIFDESGRAVPVTAIDAGPCTIMQVKTSESDGYNAAAVAGTLPLKGLVLIEWARRRQGLVLPAGNPRDIAGLKDLAAGGVTVVRRQAEAGSWLLLAQLLERAGLTTDDLAFADERAGSETELGLAILEGRAEAGLAVESVARSLKLDFLPLVSERYDLLLRRRDFFEPPVQALFAFARGAAFRARAEQMGGYDVAGLGTVHLNGP